MVYLGRPSKGCHMCRTRRIKCDETKPTCNQCAKARRQCPGYRDEFDLLFRNENQAAARRALRANSTTASTGSSSKKVTPLKESQPHPRQQSLQLSRSQTTALTNSLSIPTEDLATCHFLSNFVLVPSQEQHAARGYNHFLLPLLQQYSNNSGKEENMHFQHAFNACALASLGERYGAPGPGPGPGLGRLATGKERESLLQKGAEAYTLALRATNAALRDPVRCKEDGVLAAVLLLGMFENITAKPNTGSAWGSHVEGAIQLVKARGKNQLKSKLGLQLFVVVRTQVIIHNLITATSPTGGVSWWVNEEATTDPTATACQRLNFLAAELRSQVYTFLSNPESFSSPSSAITIKSFLARAQTIDARILQWFATLPPSWHLEPIPYSSSDNEHIFPGIVNVYPDIWTAAIYNLARTTRLVLMSIIVRCAAFLARPGDYRTMAEYAFASRTASSVVADVISSVPFHLGHLPPRKDKDGNTIPNSNNGRGLGGYFLTWPLACVVSQDYVSDAEREYARGRLRYIGDELGIKYARMLSQLKLRLPSMLVYRDGEYAAAAATAKAPTESESLEANNSTEGTTSRAVIHAVGHRPREM